MSVARAWPESRTVRARRVSYRPIPVTLPHTMPHTGTQHQLMMHDICTRQYTYHSSTKPHERPQRREIHGATQDRQSHSWRVALCPSAMVVDVAVRLCELWPLHAYACSLHTRLTRAGATPSPRVYRASGVAVGQPVGTLCKSATHDDASCTAPLRGGRASVLESMLQSCFELDPRSCRSHKTRISVQASAP